MLLPRATDGGRLGAPAGVLGVALFLVVGSAHAQGRFDVAISSAPSPVGAGARAVGVGSAFVALADDATAASWNPGGLVQLERPEISVVGRGTRQTNEVAASVAEIESGTIAYDTRDGTSSAASLDYLSGAVPFTWGKRNVVISANYQQLFSFDRHFEFTTVQTTPNRSSTVEGAFEQRGGLYALSPAIALDLVPGLSLGIALNFWFDGIGSSTAWESTLRTAFTRKTVGEPDDFQTTTTRTRNDLFNGTNAAIGMLWRPSDSFRFGLSGKLPFQASFRSVTEGYDEGVQTGERRARLRMELPLAVAAGVAVQPTDTLRVSADATHVRWGDFRLSDTQGNEYLFSGDPVDPSNPLYPAGGPAAGYHVDAVTTVRLGVEYLISLADDFVAFRSGGFWDPEPSRGAPETAFGGALGLGYTSSHFSIDVAYQLRIGRNVDGIAATTNVLAQPSTEIDFMQHTLYASMVGYF